MSEASLLMVHNAWTWTEGNADQLRKQADDLDKITRASIEAYKAHSNLSEEEIKALLDAETWILPEEALAYGFATKIEKTENKQASQSVRQSLVALIKGKAKAAEDEEGEEEDPEEEGEEEEPTEDPEADPKKDPKEDPEEDPEDGKEEESEEDDPEEPKEDESEEDDPKEPKEKTATQAWASVFAKILTKNKN